MSSMSVILGDPDRLRKMAQDIVHHYEDLVSQTENSPEGNDCLFYQEIAFRLLKEIITLDLTGENRRRQKMKTAYLRKN